MPRPETNAALSVERFFQFSLLGLVTSGYLAVAGSGYLDGPTVVLTTAGLLVRALWICGILRFEISERSATIATLAYSAFFLADYLLLSREFLPATVLAFAAARRHSPRAGIMVLVVASLVFYGAWRPVYLLLFGASVALNFLLGLAMGWIAVVHRGPSVSKVMSGWLALGAAALVALAVSRVVPGRFGYWLDLGLVLFACYLVGCAIGSWLRERVVSRPPAKPAA